VVTRAQYIAGHRYAVNFFACQSCPDPVMSMSVAGGAYTCACAAGYTLVGVSGIGNQSCVQTSLTNARKNSVTAASQVTYYGSGASGGLMASQLYLETVDFVPVRVTFLGFLLPAALLLIMHLFLPQAPSRR
jgi:hypothetical protein